MRKNELLYSLSREFKVQFELSSAKSPLLEGKLEEKAESDDVQEETSSLETACDTKLLILQDLLEGSQGFRNGGCSGMPTFLSTSLVNSFTIVAIDGLKEAKACVHKSPICRTSMASFAG